MSQSTYNSLHKIQTSTWTMLICNVLLGFLNYKGFLYHSFLRQLRNQKNKSLFTATPSQEETERQSLNMLLQARILEWVAIPFSRRSSPTQGWNPGLLHCRWILYQLSHEGRVHYNLQLLLLLYLFSSVFFNFSTKVFFCSVIHPRIPHCIYFLFLLCFL